MFHRMRILVLVSIPYTTTNEFTITARLQSVRYYERLRPHILKFEPLVAPPYVAYIIGTTWCIREGGVSGFERSRGAQNCRELYQ
jgi:hypothetical protein